MPWYNVSRVLNSTSLDACYNGDAMNETECVSSGAPEYAPFFDCKCSSSLCASALPKPQKARCCTVRKPAGRKAYFDGCLDMTKSGDVDGCFVDGCLKVEAPVGKSERAAFTAAKLQNLKELQEQVPGPLICGSGGGLNPDMAASQVQAFSAKHAGWWGNMMHMNNSASQGYMFEAHGGPLCASNVSSPEFEQEYAAFLMFAQRHTCTRDLLCVVACRFLLTKHPLQTTSAAPGAARIPSGPARSTFRSAPRSATPPWRARTRRRRSGAAASRAAPRCSSPAPTPRAGSSGAPGRGSTSPSTAPINFKL